MYINVHIWNESWILRSFCSRYACMMLAYDSNEHLLLAKAFMTVFCNGQEGRQVVQIHFPAVYEYLLNVWQHRLQPATRHPEICWDHLLLPSKFRQSLGWCKKGSLPFLNEGKYALCIVIPLERTIFLHWNQLSIKVIPACTCVHPL